LKTILLEKIEEIRLALINYNIDGINGLRRSLESNLGAIFLNKEKILIDLESRKDDSSSLWKKLMEILTQLNILVDLGNNVPTLAEKTVALLQSFMS
jgi:hypothetical protein